MKAPARRSLVVKQLVVITLSILFIETAVLVPSAVFFKKQRIQAEQSLLNTAVQAVAPVLQEAVSAGDSRLVDLIYKGLRDAGLTYAMAVISPDGDTFSRGVSRLSPDFAARAISAAEKGKWDISYHPDSRMCSVILPITANHGGKSFVLCFEKDLSRVNREVFFYILRVTGVVLLILGSNSVIVYGMSSRYYLKPVYRLIEANRNVSRGDISGGHIPDQEMPDDEFGEIMRGRQEMLESLEKSKKEILEKNEKLSELLSMKNKFSAMFSHDIRQPITIIKGYAGLVQRLDVKDPMVKDSMREILTAAGALENFANSLIDLSKLQSGKLELRKQKTDVLKMVLASVEQNGIIAGSKKISIRTETDDAGDYQADIDETKMTQVINNLIGNAIKFTKEGGLIKVALSRPREGALSIRVSDNGLGIDREFQSRIFDAYVTGQSGGTRGEKGHGLGLAICKNLVELHGGNISVQSESGAGTTFFIELPAL